MPLTGMMTILVVRVDDEADDAVATEDSLRAASVRCWCAAA